MKKQFTLLSIQFFLLSYSLAQTTANPNAVFASGSFHFYGYEESLLKLADPSRTGQEYKKFMIGFNELMLKQFNQKEFEIIYRKGKGNIPFNTLPTKSNFEKIDFERFIGSACEKVRDDTLTAILKRYQLDEKQGIGCVVFFNCFNRAQMTIDVTMLWFDIATRSVIYSKNLLSKDKNGYNYMADWKKAAIRAMERMLKLTSKEFSAYQEEQKKLKNKK